MSIQRALIFMLTASVCCAAGAQEIKHPKAIAAKKEFESAVQQAIEKYAAKLDEAAEAAAGQSDFDEAKRIAELRKQLEQHGISTQPDPTAKAKRILLAHLFRKSSGAILDFRANYTAYGRHNGKTTNWVMTDSQTLITGATDPSKPLYIHKFNPSMTRGVVYKYQPVTGEKHQTIFRSGQ